MKNYIQEINGLELPWSKFRLEEDFYARLEGYGKEDGILRDIIYSEHPDSFSITLGALPPIVSPIFWEIGSGMRREDIHSFKFRGKPITEVTYDRYQKMFGYYEKIIKIFLVNPDAYLESIVAGFSQSKCSFSERIESIQRRLGALDIMIDSIDKNNWPKLLLIIPTAKVKNKDISFTLTPHMDISLSRDEGHERHTGHFHYYSQESSVSKKNWKKRWHQARMEYTKGRDDYPEGLLSPTDICLMENGCKNFNINSVHILKEILNNLLSEYKSTDNESDFNDGLDSKDKFSRNSLMDVIIYIALEEEELIFSRDFNLNHDKVTGGKTFCYNGVTYHVICPNRIGRVVAAVETMHAVEKIGEVDLICVLGIAGGFQSKGVNKGDVIVAKSVWDGAIRKNKVGKIQHRPSQFQCDSDLNRYFTSKLFSAEDCVTSIMESDADDWPKYRRPEIHSKYDIISLDEVVANDDYVNELIEQYPDAVAIDMESGGCAAVAHKKRIQLLAIRGISDFADPLKADDNWRKLAMRGVVKVFSNMNVKDIISKK